MNIDASKLTEKVKRQLGEQQWAMIQLQTANDQLVGQVKELEELIAEAQRQDEEEVGLGNGELVEH